MTRTRIKFNGKWYYFHAIAFGKTRADQIAKGHRALGGLARIVPEKKYWVDTNGRKRSQTHYLIYTYPRGGMVV